MKNRKDMITIGLPVYNGEKYLAQSITSVLNQSFVDLNFVVSDNASQDETENIARRYADIDDRLKYVKFSKNKGASVNYNSLLKYADTPYFKWISHDDYIDKLFVEKCIDLLEKQKDVVIAYTRVVDIDELGNELGEIYDSGLDMHFDTNYAPDRFKNLICTNHSCMSVFGVIRTDVLKDSMLIAPYVGSDRMLLAELGLRGKIYEIPEVLYHHREHSERSTRKNPKLQKRIAWFDTSIKRKLVFPNWRLLVEYVKIIFRSKLPVRQKMECGTHVLRWLRWNGAKLLLDDVKYYFWR